MPVGTGGGGEYEDAFLEDRSAVGVWDGPQDRPQRPSYRMHDLSRGICGKLPQAPDLDALRGKEGNTARIYSNRCAT